MRERRVDWLGCWPLVGLVGLVGLVVGLLALLPILLVWLIARSARREKEAFEALTDVNAHVNGNVHINGTVRSKMRNDFCLGVANAATLNGAAVTMGDCRGGGQKWTLDPHQRLVARHSGKCLDVEGQGASDYTPAMQWTCNYADNQKWDYDMASSSLRPRHAPNKCLEVLAANTNDGARVVLQECREEDNMGQQWSVVAEASS